MRTRCCDLLGLLPKWTCSTLLWRQIEKLVFPTCLWGTVWMIRSTAKNSTSHHGQLPRAQPLLASTTNCMLVSQQVVCIKILKHSPPPTPLPSLKYMFDHIVQLFRAQKDNKNRIKVNKTARNVLFGIGQKYVSLFKLALSYTVYGSTVCV